MTTRRLIRPTLPPPAEREAAVSPENRIVREPLPVDDRSDFRDEGAGRRDFHRDRHQGGHHRRHQGGQQNQRHQGGGQNPQRHHANQSKHRHHNNNKHRQGLDLTFAESFYYLKQMKNRTPMVVRLLDGEDLRGKIEWYDRDAIKLARRDEPNLLIPKRNIKYIFKDEDAVDTTDFDDNDTEREDGNGRDLASSSRGDDADDNDPDAQD